MTVQLVAIKNMFKYNNTHACSMASAHVLLSTELTTIEAC